MKLYGGSGKLTAIILTFIIAMYCTGCEANGESKRQSARTATHTERYIPNIDYRQVYAETIGFCLKENGPMPKAPERDAYLFKDEKSWKKFKDTYLKGAEIPSPKFPNQNLLYVRVKWAEQLSGSAYQIIGLNIRNNRLEIEVKQLGSHIFASTASRDIYLSYVMLAYVDSKHLTPDLVPDVKIASELETSAPNPWQRLKKLPFNRGPIFPPFASDVRKVFKSWQTLLDSGTR